MNRNRKGILIIIVLLSVGIGQLYFIGINQSRRVWLFLDYSPGITSGDLTINLTPGDFSFNRYYFEACGWRSEPDDPQFGSVTFTHRGTGKVFLFEYFFSNPPSYEECDGVFWFMPSGIYDVSWNNSDEFPMYRLYNAWFLFPVDMWLPPYIVRSGSIIIFIICVIVAIKNTFNIILDKKRITDV